MTVSDLIELLGGYEDNDVLILAPDGTHREVLYLDDGESMCEPVVLLVAG